MLADEFSRFAEPFPDALLLTDPTGEIVAANGSALDGLGYRDQGLVGKSLASLCSTAPADIKAFLTLCSRTRSLIPGTLCFILLNGETLSCRCEGGRYVHPIDRDGGFILIRITPKSVASSPFDTLNRQISALSNEIGRRMKMEEALREADRRKDEFLATLAHELRNPLAPIRNSLEILKMPHLHPEVFQQTREMMERQVDQLVRLVDDLLDVSRVMRGKIELRKEPIELATVVARAVETIQPVILDRGHRLHLAVSHESLLIHGDPIRLAQVVGNLLANSAKYTAANGQIVLSAEREGAEVVLRVWDDGIGIAPDILPHVFDLFVQADHASTKAPGGLGIGLTVVKNLTQMHGGTVEARSPGLGEGCEFVVRLPLMHPQLREQTDDAQGHEELPMSCSGQRLLVVDDNPDAATSLALLLRLKGHDVRVVHDGPSALTMSASFLPKMIFLDLGMPDMDGFEVARRVRQQPGLEGVVLAALTGWGQQEDRRRTAEAGFNHHLVKPAELSQVEDLLRSLPH